MYSFYYVIAQVLIIHAVGGALVPLSNRRRLAALLPRDH
jgi:hypothetical protein